MTTRHLNVLPGEVAPEQAPELCHLEIMPGTFHLDISTSGAGEELTAAKAPIARIMRAMTSVLDADQQTMISINLRLRGRKDRLGSEPRTNVRRVEYR